MPCLTKTTICFGDEEFLKMKVKMKKNILLLLAVCATVSLSACQNVKEQLGVGRNSPDEFTVVKRAPLTLPPEYNLRPPGEGIVPPASDTSEQAKAVLMGAPEKTAEVGASEEILLQKMGTATADPAIRMIISRENGYIALQNQSVADKLIFWKEAPPESELVPSPVVNAQGEAARLKKNQEEGKPVNEGDVPVIEKKKSTIDRLF